MKHPFFSIKILVFTLILIFSLACSSNKEDMEDQAKKQHVASKNPVDTMVLHRGTFHRELVSNGRLEALQKAKLRFDVSGELEQIYVENGQRGKKTCARL
jgi:multidrug efflux pump subunit AcrA (membrane-fusion protein)